MIADVTSRNYVGHIQCMQSAFLSCLFSAVRCLRDILAIDYSCDVGKGSGQAQAAGLLVQPGFMTPGAIAGKFTTKPCECRSSLELVSFEDHRAGQELLITYGEGKASLDFLRDYGFVVPGSLGRIHFVADAAHILNRRMLCSYSCSAHPLAAAEWWDPAVGCRAPAARLVILCRCQPRALYAGHRATDLQPAAQAVQTAHAYFFDEVTDGGTLRHCRGTCMQLSDKPRLSFGLLYLAVGTGGWHEAHLPFRVRATTPPRVHVQPSHR